MEELGMFLKEMRGKTSIREASEAIGVSHTYLATLEKGKDPRTDKTRQPSFETLRSIANYYDLSYVSVLILAGVLEEKDVIDFISQCVSPSM